MSLKKTLTGIVITLAALYTLTTTACAYNEYHYNGMIDDEHIYFGERTVGKVLQVERPDGTIITYVDNSSAPDLKLDYVEITTINDGWKSRKTYWLNDEVGEPVLKEAQKQFDNYLKKILETNIQEGLDNIKK